MDGQTVGRCGERLEAEYAADIGHTVRAKPGSLGVPTKVHILDQGYAGTKVIRAATRRNLGLMATEQSRKRRARVEGSEYRAKREAMSQDRKKVAR